jgi:hypothetical protein
MVFILMFCFVAWMDHGVALENAQFEEAHSATKIVGKTVSEIIDVYGKPDNSCVTRRPDGSVYSIMYKDSKAPEYCGIKFEKDIATEVTFWGQ